jgi:hypothetical protein
MKKTEGGQKKVKKVLDTFLPKRGRGRPEKVVASAVRGRADNLTGILHQIWDSLWPALSGAKTEEDVIKALKDAHEYEGEFRNSVPLILTLLNDPKLPKRKKAQIHFLADSLGGQGLVTPRSSRDICAKDRAKDKHRHQILRYEFYVECSCGYEGHSRDHACPECGARLPFEPSFASDY